MNAFTNVMVIYMNKFNGKIWKIGGSKVLTVPNKFAKENELVIGSVVDVEVTKCIVNDTEKKEIIDLEPTLSIIGAVNNIVEEVEGLKEGSENANEHRDTE